MINPNQIIHTLTFLISLFFPIHDYRILIIQLTIVIITIIVVLAKAFELQTTIAEMAQVGEPILLLA